MKSRKFENCPDCGSDNVVWDEKREQIICRDCGLIFEPLVPELEEKFEESHKSSVKPMIKKQVEKKKRGSK